MLNRQHIKTINRTRQLLKKYELKAGSESGYAQGKFAEACKAAENSLLNVLVIARAWLGAEVEDADFSVSLEEEEELV